MDKASKKKAATSAVAAVTAASVLVGGAFTSPADILDDGPDAHVLMMDMDMDIQSDAGDGADDSAEDEQRGGFGAAVRRLVRQSPVPVRACVALPLWLLGTLLINLGTALWGAVLSPVFSAVLGWAAVALMVLMVFVLAAKTIAPDLPIRKILNRKSILGIFTLCLICGALDIALPFFWAGYDEFSHIIKAGFSCLCTAVPIGFFLRHNKRRLANKAAEAAQQELSYEQRELAARRLVEELADSVCR